jgi:anthranilate phosphoribosyltransferase
MNTVEKMLNPAAADFHMSGFYHSAYLHRMATCLPASNSWIMQGDEGSIDIRPGKKTRVYRAVDDEMVEHMIDAAQVGYPDEVDLTFPVDPNAHADALRHALGGNAGPAFDQITLTAAVLLWMLERVPTISDGLDIAREQLINQRALSVLQAAHDFA